MADAKELFMGALEILTTHQVMRYFKHGDDQEPLRIMAGAGMGALGYLYGPAMFDKLRRHDETLGTQVSQHLTYAVGGAVAGGVLGHLVGPKIAAQESRALAPLAVAPADAGTNSDVIEKPSGLVVTASTIYLAYALLFNGKSEEQRQRHWLMLGAGAIGYAYGPEIMQRTKSMLIPATSVEDALEKYNKGVALGALTGSILGYAKGEEFVAWIRRQS